METSPRTREVASRSRTRVLMANAVSFLSLSLSLSLATRMREQRTPCRSNEPRCLLSASPTQLDSPGNLERATRAPLRHTPLTPMVTTTTTLCKYKYKKYKFTGKNYNDKKHKYKYKTRHPPPLCHKTAPMVNHSLQIQIQELQKQKCKNAN